MKEESVNLTPEEIQRVREVSEILSKSQSGVYDPPIWWDGKKLDEIEQIKEEAKRPYQKVLIPLIVGVVSVLVCVLMGGIIILLRYIGIM